MNIYMNITLSATALMIVSANGYAGGGLGNATEWTQILNNGELAAQVVQQVKTYKTLYQQLQVLTANERLLNSHNFENAAAPLLAKLHRAMVTDQTVSYVGSNLNEEFERTYPDYRQYSRDTYGIEAVTNRDFDQWNAQNQANVKSALDAININRDQVLTEGQMLDLVARQAKTVESKKAIMQVGNDLALNQIHQARRMENLLQTQISLQANYLAAEQSQNVREEAAGEDNWKKEKEYLDMMKNRFDEKEGWRVPSE